MKYVSVLFVALVLVGAMNAFALPPSSDSLPASVSTAWLADHLNDPGLIVLQVTSLRRDYLAGHIPGARYLWPGYFAQSTPDLSYELVPLKQLTAAVEELGISNASRIVLCGVAGNISPTARMFITLEYLGMGGRIAILDGQFDAWKKEGREVSTETPKFKRAKFTPHLKKDAIVDAEFVKGRMEQAGVTIVDARAPQFYNATSPTGMKRDGHIPGAVNIYYTTLVDSTNKLLDRDSLRLKFTTAGVKPGGDVIAYCHVGQTASTVYYAARVLGFNAHLFDGSFEDWSSRPELPVVTPAKADTTKK